MNEKKNQHYVPQSYLKRFAIPESNGKKAMIYDLEFNIVRKFKSLVNIASEEYFYDSEVDSFISPKYKIQGTENSLADFESTIPKLLQEVENNLSRGVLLNDEVMQKLSYLLYNFYIRTKNFRENQLKVTSPEYSLEAHHSFGLIRPEVYSNILKIFANRRYVLAEACRGYNFVTSDSPVGLVSNFNLDNLDEFEKQYKRYFAERLGDRRGLDFVLPLSPRRALIGVDIYTTRVLLQKDQTSVKLDKTNTIRFIGGSVADSQKYIIGSSVEDVKYGGELKIWKDNEIKSRSDEVKQKISKILGRE